MNVFSKTFVEVFGLLLIPHPYILRASGLRSEGTPFVTLHDPTGPRTCWSHGDRTERIVALNRGEFLATGLERRVGTLSCVLTRDRLPTDFMHA